MNRRIRTVATALALIATTALIVSATPTAAATPPAVTGLQHSFGSVAVGASTTRTVSVRNTDTTGPVTITTTGGTPGSPRFTVTNGCNGTTLDPYLSSAADRCEITYTFTPNAPGVYRTTASLTVNGVAYTVHLAGRGVVAPGTISGTSTLVNASPTARSSIWVTAVDGSAKFNVQNVNGAYSIQVPPGQYCVSFGVSAYEGTISSYPGKRHCRDGITPVTVTSGATTPNINATLTLGSISGTIRDEGGVVMPDYYVRTQVVGGTANAYDQSDASGVYQLVNLAPGTYCVGHGTTNGANGPCPAGTQRAEVTAGANVAGVNIQLAPAGPDGPSGAISGKVTNGAGVAQPGREVRAQSADGIGWGGSATTAADGSYTASGLLPGSYCVSVRDDGSTLAGEYYSNKASCADADLVTVTTTTTAGIDFQLTPGATLSGKVRLPGGAPAANATVYVSSESVYSYIEATTNAAGDYTVQGLSPGQYCVRARDQWGDLPTTARGGVGTCAQTTLVTVGAAAAMTGIDVQLVEGGTIAGTVTFPAGFIPGVGDGSLMMSTRDLDGEQSNYVNVDVDGRYSTEPLAPGTYCLDVRTPAPSLLIRRTLGSLTPDYCRAGTIQVTNGAVTTLDFALELGGSVSGWVVTPNGYPDQDPSPQLEPHGGEHERVRADGSYFVTGVPAGTYCVAIHSYGLWVVDAAYDGYFDCSDGFTPVTVTAGQNTGNINFALTAGGRVSGTVTRAGGDGYDLVELHRLDAAQPVVSTNTSPASATLADYSAEVPPGTYCVLVRPHESTGNANQAYGGTPSCAGAAPVVVPAMRVVDGIDITLTRQIYRPLANPARLADTRPGRPVTAGATEGTGPINAGGVLRVQVAGLADVPAGAASVALNVTAVGASAAGHLTVFPCGEAVPTASNVNYTAGQTTPNAVIAKLGATGDHTGKVCIATHAATDIVVDVAGYFPDTNGFVPLPTPVRITDTRPGRPVIAGAPEGAGPVAAQDVLRVQVAGLADVPASAASVALNVTAVGASAAGHLTVFPCGEPLPTASNVNYTAGQTTPNAVIAKLGTTGDHTGKVCIATHAATDIVVDVAGYFPDTNGFVPLPTPARLMDSRPERPTVDGDHQAEGPIPGQTVREFQVGGRAGLPTGAASVVLNVTAVGASAAGHLTVFPCGEEVPTASNVNYVAGQTTPNAVIAKLGGNGKVCIRAHAATDVVVDVSGFFPAADGPIVEQLG
ncbi:MAG TPA: carboxypeptidase-like regulatory domain-containing protein [Ilumatobacter sp.]|nr:carboxypeptidase-like regulatory domain-containing protein [Ilumatobacter sp.]